MHSGYEVPGIQQRQQAATENNPCAPVLLSMNQTHFLDPIHTLPATTQQRLFLDHQHNFLPPQSRLSHDLFPVGAATSPGYFPAVNFKLGLNEFCTRNHNNNDYNNNTSKGGIITTVSSINEGGNLLRGSAGYEVVPEAARQPSLGMLHCWQNQQDSANKQSTVPPSFWEHLPSEVSNENSEIIDRSQEHMEMNDQREQQVPDDHIHHLTTCLDNKSRIHFGELEAIYKRLGTTTTATADSNQTGPCRTEHLLDNAARLPVGLHHGSDPEEASASLELSGAKRKRKKRRKENSSGRYLIRPMAEFFGNLVRQVMEHQENMHRKFTEVIERLEEERREREEDWRKQELVRLEQESEARANEKASVRSREAMIVSYLEKITGEKINFEVDQRGDV
ncbi:hypothetical protein OROHE_013885 [Orobanche hederae]